jgi:hypothetical protein
VRTFGRIETAFWQNAKVRALSSDETRLLLLYLFTCQHGNSVGCFVLPDGYIIADLNWSHETLSKRLEELYQNGFVTRCEATNLIRIRGWFDHNRIENPNVAKAAVKTIEALPHCYLLTQFINDLRADKSKNTEPLRKGIKTLSKGYLNPIETKEPSLSLAIERKRGDETPPEISDPEKELYQRGAQLLGANSGGLIRRLIEAKGGSIERARATVETAATKHSPREYIGGAIRKGGKPTSAEQIHAMEVITGEASAESAAEQIRKIEAI